MEVDITILMKLLKEKRDVSEKTIRNVLTAGAILLDPDTRLKYVHEAAYYIQETDNLCIELIGTVLKLAAENEILSEKLKNLEKEGDENAIFKKKEGK